MPADSRAAWTEVSDNLSGLLLKLKLHAQEELSDDELRQKAGLDRLAGTIDEIVDAIEDAYEDEAVRADAKNAGRSLLAALDATMRDVGERIRSGS